ncbi:MAG: hypothetical protein E6R11_07635 [Rhodocyclaceae bacterium]|jgi:hypothetical protein|nr:MAG: hypothetical protein E6R11_07635 [Rhodocyclaceae bacterium]
MSQVPTAAVRTIPPHVRRRRPARLVLCTLVLLLSLGAIPPSSAKRAAPATVAAVVIGAVEYSAPATAMGYIVATDRNTHRELWRQRIYEILRDPGLEADVQDVFITSLELLNGRLLIRNERGEVFLLDPGTRAVMKKP